MYHTPRLPQSAPGDPKQAPRFDEVLDRARRLDERPDLDPKRPKEVSEGPRRIVNSNQFVLQAHHAQARALKGAKVLYIAATIKGDEKKGKNVL